MWEGRSEVCASIYAFKKPRVDFEGMLAPLRGSHLFDVFCFMLFSHRSVSLFGWLCSSFSLSWKGGRAALREAGGV